MSDKDTYNFDDNFVEKSWKDMTVLLDKEMPVKKKKRRFLWLFLFLGISLPVLFYVFSNQKTFDNKVSEQVIAHEENIKNSELNIIAEENNTSVELNNLNKSEIAISNNSTSNSNEIIKNNSQSNLITKNKNPQNNFNKIVENYNYNINIPSIALTQNYNKENEVVKTTLIPGKVVEKITRQVDEGSGTKINSTIKIVEEKNNYVLNSIDGVKILLENKINEVLQEIVVVNEEEKKSENEDKGGMNQKNLWGIEAGFQTQINNEIGGKWGLVYTRKLNNKLNFHTQLEYHISRINYTNVYIENEEAIFTSNLNESTVGDPNPLDLYQEDLKNIEKNQLFVWSHKIKVPISLGYKFHSKWEANIGVGCNFNYLMKTKNAISSDDLSADMFTTGQTDPIDKESFDPIFDPQLMGGLSFYPKEKWVIGFRYDLGLKRRSINVVDRYNLSQLNNQSESVIKTYQLKNREMNLGLFARFYF